MARAFDRYSDMCVLIVDDNVGNVALLKAVAEDGGLRNLVTETDSRLVAQRLTEHDPDLVLLDLHMPHLDGYGVLTQIKQHAAQDYLPVLVLTADSTTKTRDEALRQGAHDFLTKPLDTVEVTLRMATLLENRKRYVNLQRGRRWLTASSDLSQCLLTPGNARALTMITDSALDAAMADFAILVLADEGDRVKVAAASGVLGPDLVGQSVTFPESLWARTMQTGGPDLGRGCFTNDHPAFLDGAIGPLLFVPLSVEHLPAVLILGRVSGGARQTVNDLALAASFATQAGVVLELAHAREIEIDLARREDRDRIAADLHDHVIQDLFAVGIGLQGLASITENPEIVSRILGYAEGLDRAIGIIRTTIFELQHDHYASAGLKARILAVVAEHTRQLGYSPRVLFDGSLDCAIDQALVGDVLAVVREGISNCARHAHASRLEISIGVAEKILTVEITDNGRGVGASTRSSGLKNMRSRAEKGGGSLTVTTPLVGGTRLTWKRSLV